MDEPALEGIEEQIVPVTRSDALDQPFAFIGQRRPARLEAQQRRAARELG